PPRTHWLEANATKTRRLGGWILYDGKCRFCIAAANQFRQLFARRGFAFTPLQTPWVQRRLGLVPGAPLEEMRVLTVDGEHYGGANAVLFLANQIWWLRPLGWIGKLPFVHPWVDAGYRWIAARRGCTHLQCASKERRFYNRRLTVVSAAGKPRSMSHGEEHVNGSDPAGEYCRNRRLESRCSLDIAAWIPLVILPVSALFVRNHVEPWLFMWLMVGAIFLGCKWFTLHVAAQNSRPAIIHQLAYFLLWPDMDAGLFLGPKRAKSTLLAELPNIAAALGKMALGALLLWGFARHFTHDLVAGWIGMIGLILIAHFGMFSLAAAGWRLRGRPARPIMNAPWKADKLAGFWGRRWNRAFQQLVIETVFRPMAGSIGVVRATLITFFISGLLHELVISLPAGAGYGLPTSYFLLQGWGMIAQRTPIAGRYRFNNRLFTLFLVALPAFGLFHPPFVRGVIVPFMHAIGAL
ncbi:MAG TPA: DCC1-like thiol-disulfide oxidoreductase family protein, partial [Chthoniobacterales bacterium]|nr:DCC1-like thiol-disulfide oxidoreductase family protein [Chthoniobacterales bacterium]